jgi:hypothetical protein
MAVEAELTRAILREEVRKLREYGKTFRWGIVPNLKDLAVLATLYAHDGELFIVRFECSDYKECPPTVEFLDPETGEPGTRHAYPKGNCSFFHEKGPCICAPFNRKAYGLVHTDWAFANWTTSQVNNTDWSTCATLVGMLAAIQTKLDRLSGYNRRMA